MVHPMAEEGSNFAQSVVGPWYICRLLLFFKIRTLGDQMTAHLLFAIVNLKTSIDVAFVGMENAQISISPIFSRARGPSSQPRTDPWRWDATVGLMKQSSAAPLRQRGSRGSGG